MAGLVPAIHALIACKKDMDARHKAGHDEQELAISVLLLVTARM